MAMSVSMCSIGARWVTVRLSRSPRPRAEAVHATLSGQSLSMLAGDRRKHPLLEVHRVQAIAARREARGALRERLQVPDVDEDPLRDVRIRASASAALRSMSSSRGGRKAPSADSASIAPLPVASESTSRRSAPQPTATSIDSEQPLVLFVPRHERRRDQQKDSHRHPAAPEAVTPRQRTDRRSCVCGAAPAHPDAPSPAPWPPRVVRGVRLDDRANRGTGSREGRRAPDGTRRRPAPALRARRRSRRSRSQAPRADRRSCRRCRA